MIVFLDTSVLGQVVNPGKKSSILECRRWFEKLLARSALVLTSEICEYEVRRGLEAESLKQGKGVPGLRELEDLKSFIDFLPVDSEVWQEAAKIWAEAKFKSILMTHPARLDADGVICGHWRILDKENPGRAVVVATENLRDLNRFSTADHWRNIRI